jgi:hypothetical protein
MESNTDSLGQWAKIGIGVSSIEFYKRKKFAIPGDLNLSYQRILNAKNSPDFERIDVDVRIYF